MRNGRLQWGEEEVGATAAVAPKVARERPVIRVLAEDWETEDELQQAMVESRELYHLERLRRDPDHFMNMGSSSSSASSSTAPILGIGNPLSSSGGGTSSSSSSAAAPRASSSTTEVAEEALE